MIYTDKKNTTELIEKMLYISKAQNVVLTKKPLIITDRITPYPRPTIVFAEIHLLGLQI